MRKEIDYIICEEAKPPVAKVSKDAWLADLGFTGKNIFDLVRALEDEFAIYIYAFEIEQLRAVEDVYNLVERKTK